MSVSTYPNTCFMSLPPAASPPPAVTSPVTLLPPQPRPLVLPRGPIAVDITELISPSLTQCHWPPGVMEDGQPETVETGAPGRGRWIGAVVREFCWAELLHGWNGGGGGRHWTKEDERKDGELRGRRDLAEAVDADELKETFFVSIFMSKLPSPSLWMETECSHVRPLCYVHFWE